jgi:radical SAM superfamily enzyme YgiQ (UPF0313 family)
MRLLTLPCLAAEFSRYCAVEVCDQNIEEIDYSDCDMVGISLLVYNAPIGYEIAKRFRDRGIPVIMGGSWPTVSPHLVAPYCDSVVIGEVECLGEQIVTDLKKGKLKKTYKNKVPPSLDTLRPPRFDLLKNERYHQAMGYPMELTRGCVNACTFCISRRIQPTFRKKPYWMVIRELEARDSPMLNLYDLNAAADIEYFKDIARIFAEFPLMGWSCETCIGYLEDEQLLKLLERSRLHHVYVGIESISERSLATINKSFNQVNKYRKIIQKCHDHGIHVAAGFIVGLDGEDKSIFEKSLDFFNEVRIDYTTPLYVTYLPGTSIHNKLKKEGRILTENLADYDGAHPIVRPDMMTVEELREGVEWFLKEFYGASSIALRALQKPNLNPIDLLGYISLNTWFANMYNTAYKRDEHGRCPINHRELFDKLTLRPFEKKEFGFGLLEDLMTVVNKADRMLRPIQRIIQSIRLPSNSMTNRYRFGSSAIREQDYLHRRKTG